MIDLYLTPKIPCVFLTKLCSFRHRWKNQIFKKVQFENLKKCLEDLEVTLLGINLKKLWLLIPWDLGDYNIQTSILFFLVCFLV
jgi:hypothetical protein